MPRVLVVDESQNMRGMLAEILQRGGYDSLAAPDCPSAASLVGQQDIDAIVLDTIGPNRESLDLLCELHEPYIPMIMITGKLNLTQVSELVRRGIYDFVSKPIVEAELLRAVSNAVEKKHLTHLKERLERKLLHHTEQLERAVAERTRELAEAHSFLHTVLDSSTEYAIIAIDMDGRIMLFNHGAELVFGHSPRRMAGRLIDELIPVSADGARQTMGARARAAIVPGRRSEEIEWCRADGSRFIGSVIITPINKPGGELIGSLCIIKDTTAERRNQEHLRQLHERLAHNEKIAALGRMAAQVAHEVRNPLAGMRLYALHLRSKAADRLPDNELALIDKIADAINKLSDTTEQVLNFARPVNLLRQRGDLNALVKDALSLLEPQTLAKRISVALDLSPAGAEVWFDEAAMRSALINLLLNAIQAMGEGGNLRLATNGAGGEVELTVEDDGCGMTAEQVQTMFEPFYTTKSRGLGLGMSFAARVVEQHGGNIQVRSQAGSGTQVKLTLSQNGESPHASPTSNPHC